MAVGKRWVAVDLAGFGLLLWVAGFVLGFLLLSFQVDNSVLGWFILPILVPLTAWVAYLRLRKGPRNIVFAAVLGGAWTIVAVALDYLVIVLWFATKDYYDVSILLYYGLTLLTPILVGAFVAPRGE